MKTTEIFIEQVLVGFLLLLAFALPYTSEIWSSLLSPPISTSGQDAAAGNSGSGTSELFKTLGAGAVLVGMAYLLGLLFDRYADQITQPLERHIRTLVAIRTSQIGNVARSGDAFPEDIYRTYMLQTATEAAADWFSYLRSAVRLCRAMAMLLPGITLGAILGYYGARFDWPAPPFFSPRAFWGPGVLAVSYLGLPLLGSALSRAPLIKNYRPPRTNEPEWRAYRDKRVRTNGKSKTLAGDIMLRAITWIGVVLLFVAWLCAREAPVPATDLLPDAMLVWLAGATLSILTVWVWWRVTATFMGYLKRFAHLAPPIAAAGVAAAMQRAVEPDDGEGEGPG